MPATLSLFEHSHIALRRSQTGWEIPAGSGTGLLQEDDLDDLDMLGRQVVHQGSPSLQVSRRGEIRVGPAVGIARTRGVVVEILPKVDRGLPAGERAATARSNLIEFLSYSRHLPKEPERDAPQQLSRLPLYEAILRLFALSLVEALRDGPWATYCARQDDLPTLRGRIDFSRQVQLELSRPGLMACRHRPYTVDHMINRVLRYGAFLASCWTQDATTTRLLLRAEALLADVPLARCRAEDCDTIRFHRLNAHLEAPVRWTRLLLGSVRPDLSAGTQPAFVLLVDMARVFQDYVARLCQQFLPAHGYRVKRQARVGHLLFDESGARIPQVPDLLLSPAEGPSIVLDTKYSTCDDDPSEADLRQMLAYMSLIRGKPPESGAPPHDAVLLYAGAGCTTRGAGSAWLTERPGAAGTGGLRVTWGHAHLGSRIVGVEGRLRLIGQIRGLLPEAAPHGGE